MWARFAPATGSLWGQQPLAPEQPQHPLAADLHAVLATQPGPDLAVALPGERRIGQHPPDQPHQFLWSEG
jgi:hypothetical protein